MIYPPFWYFLFSSLREKSHPKSSRAESKGKPSSPPTHNQQTAWQSVIFSFVCGQHKRDRHRVLSGYCFTNNTSAIFLLVAWLGQTWTMSTGDIDQSISFEGDNLSLVGLDLIALPAHIGEKYQRIHFIIFQFIFFFFSFSFFLLSSHLFKWQKRYGNKVKRLDLSYNSLEYVLHHNLLIN